MSSEPPGGIPPPPPPPPPAMPPPPSGPLAAPGGQPAYAYPAQPRTDGMAIAALVVGIVAAVGVFCYGVVAIILGPIAIFLGLRAKRRIQASGGALSGGGMATAGWIIGLIAAILGVLYLIFVVVIGVAFITGAIKVTPTPTLP